MRTAIVVCVGLIAAGCASRSTPPTTAARPAAKAPTTTTARSAPATTPATPGAPAARPAAADGEAGEDAGARGERRDLPELRAYDRVITKEARTESGVFTVHRIRDRVFYEIPKEMLGREFLWVSQIASTTAGVGSGGQAAGNRVVRWERRDRRVLLRSVSYEIVADPSQPIARAVHNANFDTILMAFPIQTIGKKDAPVIDVSALFTTEVPEFNVRARIRARAFDGSRAFVERVKAFPTNIEVRAIHTFTTPAEPPGGGQGPAPAPAGAPAVRPGSSSLLMSYSMVLLPEKPMQPRLHDDRVGYFSLTQRDFGVDEHRAPERRYITRWRLEKQDPSAAVSEPVKPIVYYIDPATPAKWVPFVKRGVEAWQPAFEAAGFRKAIVAKDAPTAAEDPEWSPEDARYSVIRWLPSTIENAQGPHVHDPRSGEILESDILMYHNVMRLLTHWYFVQAGPLDEWAREQDRTPWLRFSTANSAGSDPGELTEAVGDEDAIKATTLGLKNLERVGAMLLPATERPGEPFDDLELAYSRLLGQWVLEMNHVAAIVGGFASQQKHGGQAGVVFTPIPKARQIAAVQFLSAHAFQTPRFLVDPAVLRRIEPAGALDRLRTAQQRVLGSLLSSGRLLRLVEREAVDGAGAYAPTDFLADVRRGVWTELDGTGPVRIDAFRRNLQRAWLETLAERVNGRQASSDDARALFRQELRLIEEAVRGGTGRAADGVTRAHLADARALALRALDPSVQAAVPANPARRESDALDGAIVDGDLFDVNLLPAGDVCWPDYAIGPTGR